MHLNWKIIATYLLTSFSFIGSPAFADLPSTSAYYQDTQSTHNNDETSQAFGLISTVSCIMSKMHPEYNEGQTYVAWFSVGVCDNGGSGSTAITASTPFEKATVTPTYNAATGILNVKMWLEGQDSDSNNGVTTYTPTYIWVNVDVEAGPSVTPPLGRWSMQYCQQSSPVVSALEKDPSSCDLGYGYGVVTPDLLTVFNTYYRNGVLMDSQAGSASYALSGGQVISGQGQFVNFNNWDSPPSDRTYSFAFLGDNYRLKSIDNTSNSGVSDVCTSRNIGAVAPLFNNWSGNLYNASTGAVIDLAGGFNLKRTTGRVTDWSKTGWIGYWGPWFPEQDSQGNPIAALVDGDTLYGNGRTTNDVAFTYRKALGSLQSRTVAVKELSDVDKVRFTAWLNNNVASISGGAGNYQMYWDNAAQKFMVEGKQGQDWQTYETDSGKTGSFTIAELVATSQTDIWGGISNTNTGFNFRLGYWNGGSNPVARSLNVADAEHATVNQSTNNDIYPGTPESGPVDLADGTVFECYGDTNRCPAMLGAGSPEPRSSNGYDGSLTPVLYRWNNATGNLVHVASNLPVSSSSQRDIGPLFVQGTDVTAYACRDQRGGAGDYGFWSPDPNNAGQWIFTVGGICSGKAWNTAGTFFQWQTNTSNRDWPSRGFIVRQSDSKRPVFDKQINVRYSLNGQQQNLTYNGRGQFWTPNNCIDKTTRLEVSCSDNGGNRFYASKYNIPFTTAATGRVSRVDDPATEYLVKFLGRSFIYGLSTDAAACSALAPPTDNAIPTAFAWKDPHASGSSTFIGPWRAPNDDPLYVNGETPN